MNGPGPAVLTPGNRAGAPAPPSSEVSAGGVRGRAGARSTSANLRGAVGHPLLFDTANTEPPPARGWGYRAGEGSGRRAGVHSSGSGSVSATSKRETSHPGSKGGSCATELSPGSFVPRQTPRVHLRTREVRSVETGGLPSNARETHRSRTPWGQFQWGWDPGGGALGVGSPAPLPHSTRLVLVRRILTLSGGDLLPPTPRITGCRAPGPAVHDTGRHWKASPTARTTSGVTAVRSLQVGPSGTGVGETHPKVSECPRVRPCVCRRE